MGFTRSAAYAVHRTNMAAARVTMPAAHGRAQQCLQLTSGLPQPSTQVLRRRPAANLPLCRDYAESKQPGLGAATRPQQHGTAVGLLVPAQ